MKQKQRHTYKFNPHTLQYEKVFVSLRERVKRISFNVLFGVVLGVVLVVVGLQFIDSPKERALQREVAQYRRQTRQLSERVDLAEKVLANLEERDDALYRTIFESAPVRAVGEEDSLNFSRIDHSDNEQLLEATTQKVDQLAVRLYRESISLDEVYEMARTKNERLAAMPAIMPVAKTQGKVVSGYGMRFHPILKYRRQHSGIDITARQGTPIYATGDGVVVQAGRNVQGLSGYGIVVVINHGFGFQTLYAHMQSVGVRVGQKVKRGEQIGTVGSTGISTGSHLHYEVMLNGNKVDPIYYFSGDLTPSEYEEVLELARQENQCMS